MKLNLKSLFERHPNLTEIERRTLVYRNQNGQATSFGFDEEETDMPYFGNFGDLTPKQQKRLRKRIHKLQA